MKGPGKFREWREMQGSWEVNLMEIKEMKGKMGGKVRVRATLQARQGT